MFKTYFGISNKIKEKGWEGFMDRFPILFQNRNKSIKESCMYWGIECPIGWYDILDQLCNELEYLNMEHYKKYGVAIVAEQVKEKFGVLRFYSSVNRVDEQGNVVFRETEEEAPNNELIVAQHLSLVSRNMIEEAEHMTETICASCGVSLDEENKVRNGFSNMCKACAQRNEVNA